MFRIVYAHITVHVIDSHIHVYVFVCEHCLIFVGYRSQLVSALEERVQHLEEQLSEATSLAQVQ